MRSQGGARNDSRCLLLVWDTSPCDMESIEPTDERRWCPRIVQHHASLAAERVVVIPTVGPGDWMTTDTLTMHATAQRKLARNLEEKIFDQCEERVGILLVELDMAFDEEVPRRCDAIGAGDSLGRDQFRTLVRGLKSPGALITQDSTPSPIDPTTLEAACRSDRLWPVLV